MAARLAWSVGVAWAVGAGGSLLLQALNGTAGLCIAGTGFGESYARHTLITAPGSLPGAAAAPNPGAIAAERASRREHGSGLSVV